MLAVAYDQLETAELLLTQGKARSSEKDEDDKNALMLACEKGNTPMVALLMDHGATLTSWDNDGWTPLMYAAKNGRVEVIKLMIERYPKQNLNRTNNKNETALAIAIAHNQTMVVEVLKAAGAK
jgi:ankyrin repeat protein